MTELLYRPAREQEGTLDRRIRRDGSRTPCNGFGRTEEQFV